MKKAIQDVVDFHTAMGQPVMKELTTPDAERIHLRANLIFEECQEILEALYPELHVDSDDGVTVIHWGDQTRVDHVELADGLADLIYVVIGAANEFGIPLEKVWNEVHRSNMAKIGPNGEVVKRKDGKVIKPAGWTPPDIEGCLK